MNMLFSLANAFMNLTGSSMGQLAVSSYEKYKESDHPYHWVYQLCEALNSILTPILIIVATAGLIYAVVLGVNLARADSSDKQQEAKKRLIYAIVGLVVIIVLIIFIRLFIANIDAFLGLSIDDSGQVVSGGEQQQNP